MSSNDRSPQQHFLGAMIAVLFVLLMPWATLAEDGEAHGMTTWDVTMLQDVSSLAISPDGSHIAYLLDVPRDPFRDEDGSAWRELHVVDTEGNSRPFITGHEKVSQVDWLPDSRHLAFLAKRGDDEHTGLYIMPLDGGEARLAVTLESGIDDYSFSPDGKHVALTAEQPEPAEREEMVEKGFSQKVYEEQVRPVELWIAALEGDGEPRQVTVEGSLHGVAWEPNGERLALKVAPTPLVDDSYMETRVWVVHSQSGEVLSRIENPGKLGDIAWSPDGAHLALIAGEDRHDPREGRLMVAPSTGGELKDLLPGLLGHVSQILWKDAETVRFVSGEGTGTRLGEVTLNGQQTTLMEAGDVIWRQADAADDGSLALRGDHAHHPEDVFHWQPGGEAPKRLTNSNPWLAERRLAQQDVVRYAARDGLEIEGILIRPLDEKEGKRYPLILMVHGGPEAHYSNGWMTHYASFGQMAAARGFAVFFPNYRASTGRGVEFSKLDHGDPAGKEFDDLVDGVDHLIDMGLVDKDRVGVTGASYGGYATAWSATYYSERFAAAVMSVGISNKISSLGNSDIPMELYDVHVREWPWDDWQLYLERSPIYHVQKARTPILILHGEDDTRVFPGQSMELYRFLKILGNVQVRLVFYPDEGHGNQRAASRYDYMVRTLRWMEHYLKGAGGVMPPVDVPYPDQPED